MLGLLTLLIKVMHLRVPNTWHDQHDLRSARNAGKIRSVALNMTKAAASSHCCKTRETLLPTPLSEERIDHSATKKTVQENPSSTHGLLCRRERTCFLSERTLRASSNPDCHVLLLEHTGAVHRQHRHRADPARVPDPSESPFRLL